MSKQEDGRTVVQIPFNPKDRQHALQYKVWGERIFAEPMNLNFYRVQFVR